MALCICFFFFINISKESKKKPQQKTRRQSSLILSVVTEGGGGHAGRGGLLCKLGSLKHTQKKQKKIQRSKIMKLFSVHSIILISSNYVVSNVTHQSGTVKKRTLSAGCQHPLSTPGGYPPSLQSPPWLWVHLQRNSQHKCSVSTFPNKLDRCGKSSSNTRGNSKIWT